MGGTRLRQREWGEPIRAGQTRYSGILGNRYRIDPLGSELIKEFVGVQIWRTARWTMDILLYFFSMGNT